MSQGPKPYGESEVTWRVTTTPNTILYHLSGSLMRALSRTPGGGACAILELFGSIRY